MTKSFEEERKPQEQENARPSVTIARKPLPLSSAHHPLPPVPQEPPYQPYGGRDDQSKEEQSNGDAFCQGPLRVDTGPDFGMYRKYFSSSPQPPGLYEASGDYAVSSPSRESHSADHAGQAYGNHLSTRNSPPHSYNPSIFRNPSPPKPEPITPLDVARRTDPNFTPITIIRRDPTSGSQWNIGTITLLKPTFAGSPLRPVHVELTTPGYGRFARTDFKSRRRGSGASDAASVRRAIESMTVSPISTTSSDFPINPFVRTVDFRKMALSDLRRTVYQRTNSSDSLGRISDPSKPNVEKNALAFDSPWNGTCTFVNGIDGKTLKLKHTIQSASSPSADSNTASLAELRFNLGWSVLGNVKSPRHRSDEPDKLPIPRLLESKKENFRRSFQQLRHKSRESFQRSKFSNSASDDRNFSNEDVLRNLSNINTPTINNLAAPSSARSSTYSAPHRRNSRLTASNSAYPYDKSDPASSAHPTPSENEDENRLSLKLGREKAGGGYRGHSAKLGKLIIEDEGLKMCDLVVGAAMGVWWQHYGG